MNPYELTPVEGIGSYLFKREDLYKPFDFSPVNGSKLRQCEILLEKQNKINGVITGTSIHSPQAPIIASVCKDKEIPCEILYGGTSLERLQYNKYAILCKNLGAEVKVASKFAYTSVLNKKAQDFADEKGWFNVRYGFDLASNIDVFIDSTARQISNIPNVDNLVVTVGSAITILGILYGISLYNKKIKKVYAVGCAPNRVEKIHKYANMIYLETLVSLPLDKICYIDGFNLFKGFKYENTLMEEYHGINFHPRYEAKTFNWLKTQKLKGETLMWITGSDF